MSVTREDVCEMEDDEGRERCGECRRCCDAARARSTELEKLCAEAERLMVDVVLPKSKAIEEERGAARDEVERLSKGRDNANKNLAAVMTYVGRLESLFGGAEILAGHVSSSGSGEMANRAMDWLARYENVQSINVEGGTNG